MNKLVILFVITLIGCGPAASEKKPNCGCKYKEGEIVCLVLTGQKVLVTESCPNVPKGWYTIVVDYTNPDSRYPQTKRVVEFELAHCDSIPQ